MLLIVRSRPCIDITWKIRVNLLRSEGWDVDCDGQGAGFHRIRFCREHMIRTYCYIDFYRGKLCTLLGPCTISSFTGGDLVHVRPLMWCFWRGEKCVSIGLHRRFAPDPTWQKCLPSYFLDSYELPQALPFENEWIPCCSKLQSPWSCSCHPRATDRLSRAIVDKPRMLVLEHLCC